MGPSWLLRLGLILLASVISLCGVRGSFPKILECDYYDAEFCDLEEPDGRCNQGTNCDPAPGRPAYCMAQWRNNSAGVIQVTKKGCWGEDKRCEGRTGCYEDRFTPQTYFCCCEGTRCNANFTYNPQKPYTEEDKQVTVCEYYDPVLCKDEPQVCDMKSEVCQQPDQNSDKNVHCYAMWTNNSGDYMLEKKGCWLNHPPCLTSSCINVGMAEKSSFCCCTGNMCNVDVEQRIEDTTEQIQEEIIAEDTGMNQLVMTLVCSLVPIIAITTIILFTYWLWRRQRQTEHEPLPTIDPSPIPPPSPQMTSLKPLQLIEIKARGRFGCVWKAQMINEIVAVKIFPLQDRQSYLTEKDIYQLPYFSSHENVLKFLGGERRGDHLNAELWLISEFHEKGSLYDFLKGNLVSWADVIKISESMTRGLAFLHEEISSHNPCTYKPAVVHRDFKSKNVLIKRDNTACIADFGLALKFDPIKPIGDTHGQVGTRRYMAPEVLEGAINFSRDHFLRIDMYACGLVLWEIMTRCSGADGPVDEYQLPFEDAVGQHPSLEDMQDEVVSKKSRPPFKEQWAAHQGLTSLYQTITECWDTDPEARLSAGCVQERVSQLATAPMYPTSNQLPPVLTNTNSQTPPKEPMLVL